MLLKSPTLSWLLLVGTGKEPDLAQQNQRKESVLKGDLTGDAKPQKGQRRWAEIEAWP